MDQDRYTKKRNSLVGGGLAKFEGAQAADQFARRQSSYHTKVRQSIPDIRFDENGMPISTRQLQARSHSLAGGSLFPPDRRYSRDGVRRGSEQVPGGEKNVRKLSKKFSLDDEEELKANFTIPANTRAGMFGTNRRWSVKPEWMKKRKSSLKEEFIEKNLSNLELLSPTSRQEVEDEMASILEEMAPPSGDKTGSFSDDASHDNDLNQNEDSSSGSGSGSSSEEEYSDSEEHSHSDGSAQDDSKNDVEEDNHKKTNNDDDNPETETQEKIVAVESSSARKPLKSGKKKRKSKKGKKSDTSENLPPRPPPPPLPIQMCDVTEFLDTSSSSDDDDDTVLTQYGKQKLFVSQCYHVFEITNGPLKEGRD